MLFSNTSIADFINQNFEPTWQSLRPVPIVRIDFGQNHLVTRTLHGNIATYVCRSNGQVLDILPGLYESKTYFQQLNQILLLKTLVEQSRRHPDATLKNYHRRQAQVLTQNERPNYLQRVSRGSSITGRELGVKVVLSPGSRSASRARAAAGQPMRPTDEQSRLARTGPDASLLAEDTGINESVRRRLIHAYLADHASTTPAEITKWLYREVLKADLDDPYLGLGELLFGHGEMRGS